MSEPTTAPLRLKQVVPVPVERSCLLKWSVSSSVSSEDIRLMIIVLSSNGLNWNKNCLFVVVVSFVTSLSSSLNTPLRSTRHYTFTS